MLYSWDRASLDMEVVYITNKMQQIHNCEFVAFCWLYIPLPNNLNDKQCKSIFQSISHFQEIRYHNCL
jgi:hypothetical protein